MPEKLQLVLSKHARANAQRRGIGYSAIQLVFRNGDRTRMPGADGFRITLTRNRARILASRKTGLSQQLIDRSIGVTLVVRKRADSWYVITVYHKAKRQFEQRSFNSIRERNRFFKSA